MPDVNEGDGGARLRTPAKAPRPVEGRPTPRARAAGRAMPRAAKPEGSRPGRTALMWRRQRRLLRPAAWAMVAFVAIGTTVSLVRTVQPGSTIAGWREKLGAAVGLPVADVVVEGREKTPEPMLRAALGVAKGDTLLGFSLDAARARIESLPWVQSATVERRLPGTVVVTLLERRPFAVWQSVADLGPDKFVLIDRAGQVVAEQDPVKDKQAFATLPLVVGHGAPGAAAAILDLLAKNPPLRSRVVAAVRVGERRWNLHLASGGDVLLPEGNEAAAIGRLMELQASQQLLDRPLQVVDLRLGDRLVVRPMPEPKPAPRRPT